jgi:hypothetical protein
MQINAASLLAAQQSRPQAASQRAPAKPQADDLFEPLFGKAELKTAAAAPTVSSSDSATSFARPGSKIDIRI